MILANRIRTIRESHKLIQADVAIMINVSPSAYGQIERKSGSSSFDTLDKIATAIDVSSSFLVDINNSSYKK